MKARVLLALLLAVAGSAHAQWRERGDRVEMSIIDRDAYDELPQYAHRGQAWVPGVPGHRYAVKLTNRGPTRVLVVLSVDGINAVTGQTASASQAGYVLQPYATMEVAGWRKSMRDVAQFYFSDLRDSYAARTGRARNVGVIGIAVFDEARRIAPPPRVYLPARAEGAASDASAPTAAAAPPRAQSRAAQELGTGHGEREYAPVSRTGFVRASYTPTQVTEVRYDDARRLAQRGILPRRHPGDDYGPQAFPDGFVPDPPRGW